MRDISADSGLGPQNWGYSVNFRYLPNAISLARLMSVPILFWLGKSGAQQAFAWLLLAAGLSDVLDGWLARKYGWTTAVGALLDSFADVMVIVVTLYGIWVLQPEVFFVHWPMLLAVCVIWGIVHGAALIRYGRLASFHTRLTQLGIALFGLFVMILFFVNFEARLFYLAAAICFLGGVESLIMIILVSTWTPDLRGGLVDVIRRRKIQNSS